MLKHCIQFNIAYLTAKRIGRGNGYGTDEEMTDEE